MLCVSFVASRAQGSVSALFPSKPLRPPAAHILGKGRPESTSTETEQGGNIQYSRLYVGAHGAFSGSKCVTIGGDEWRMGSDAESA